MDRGGLGGCKLGSRSKFWEGDILLLSKSLSLGVREILYLVIWVVEGGYYAIIASVRFFRFFRFFNFIIQVLRLYVTFWVMTDLNRP